MKNFIRKIFYTRANCYLHSLPLLCLFIAWLTAIILSCNNTSGARIDSASSENNNRLIELGRLLFFDNNLSFNKTKSCASCHDPKFAFTDNYRRSITSTGEVAMHNAPSLINVAENSYFDWANPNVINLMKQSDRPLFGTAPVELGAHGHEEEILKRIQQNDRYSKLFSETFIGNNRTFSFDNIKSALAAYVASLRSYSSPYDAYNSGDNHSMSIEAQNGMKLFFSGRLNCASCHRPPLFTTANLTNNPDSIYFNTGLYNVSNEDRYPTDDNGLRAITHKQSDDGRFKVPSLRNLALTAPYTHDGSVNSIEEMIAIYERGGRKIDKGLFKGDGKSNAYKDKRVSGFTLTSIEKQELIAFLYALTDSTVLVNPAFQNPFPTNK